MLAFIYHEPVAQLVEQRPFKPLVRSSNLRWLTKKGFKINLKPFFTFKIKNQAVAVLLAVE